MQYSQENQAMKVTLSIQDAQGKQSEHDKQSMVDENENLEARAKLAVEKDIMETSKSTGFHYKISKKNKNRLIKNKIKDFLMQQDKDLRMQQDLDFRLQQDLDFRMQQLQQDLNLEQENDLRLQQEKNISLQQNNEFRMQQEKKYNEFRIQQEKQDNEFRMQIILLEQTLIVPQLAELRDLKLALPSLRFSQCVSRIHYLMAYDHYFRFWVENNYMNEFLEEPNNTNELWRIAMTWFCLNVDQARLNDEVLKTLHILLDTQINIKNRMHIFAESESKSESESESESESGYDSEYESEMITRNHRSSMYLDTQIKIKKRMYLFTESESESKSEKIQENRHSMRYLETDLIPFVKAQFIRLKTPPMKGDIATANVLFFPFRSTGFDFEPVISLVNTFLGGERKIGRIPIKSYRIPSDISMVLR